MGFYSKAKVFIATLWEKHSLFMIVFTGMVFRVLAVIFSKGYGMSDDHFQVIEAADETLQEGYPWTTVGHKLLDGHSLIYPLFHYFLFLYLKWRGITDPQTKMYIVRALHGLWSLLTIIYGYKIAELCGGLKTARKVGLLLSILWFFPMLSVRNLVEMACIPPMVIATWYLINPANNTKWREYCLVGFLLGIAFDIRFQTIFFVAGIGLVLLVQRKWKSLILVTIFFFVTALLIHGIVDTIVWGQPFTELRAYIRYNMNHATDYINGPWYKYIVVIAGALLPPASIFLLIGFFLNYKKYPLLFLPGFLFLLIHSIFPNKQERFILPIIPFLIIGGCIGWEQVVDKSMFWKRNKKLLRTSWLFFWTVNCIALPVVSVAYSKRSRVEVMSYLYRQPDLQNYIVEESNLDDVIQLPYYYAGRYNFHPPGITKNNKNFKAYTEHNNDPTKVFRPNYIIFFGNENLNARVDSFKAVFPQTYYRATIKSGFLDYMLNKINPMNRNETAYIYKFNDSVLDSTVGSPLMRK